MEERKKKELVNFLIEKGIIITEDILNLFDQGHIADAYYDLFFNKKETDKEKLREISKQMMGVDIIALLEQSPEKNENKENNNEGNNNKEETQEKNSGRVNIVFSYKNIIKKREIQDFVTYFNLRYNSIKKMLMNRKELENPISISRAAQKTEKERIAIIGMISEKRETKKGNIILVVEDPTGKMNVLASKNNPEVYAIAKDLVLDEVAGFYGMSSEGIIFTSGIALPDIPNIKELKRAPDEAYALFMGDTHLGSKSFLAEDFEKFIDWINGRSGSEEQKKIAAMTKYIFIIGDIVDGVGIYPGQEEDLKTIDIYEQYAEFSKQIMRIPSNIKIIISPGNHDAMRIAEPQPEIYQDFAEALWKMPNVVLTTNPGIVNIHASENFPGFDILLYHGLSFPYYGENVESIRASGGLERADLIMKFLLQRRHLAPTHTSTQYIPDVNSDPLLIEKIPDMFITGHIHRVSVSNYRNISLINCSSWIGITPYQEKVGLIPQPGRVIAVNLQTRKSKLLNFLTEKPEKTQMEKEINN